MTNTKPIAVIYVRGDKKEVQETEQVYSSDEEQRRATRLGAIIAPYIKCNNCQINSIISAIINEKKISISRTLDKVSCIYINDVLRSICYALTELKSGVYNIAGKVVFSNNDEYFYDASQKKVLKNGGIMIWFLNLFKCYL